MGSLSRPQFGLKITSGRKKKTLMLKTSSSSLLVVKVHIYTNTHKSNKNCIVGNARAQFWQQM